MYDTNEHPGPGDHLAFLNAGARLRHLIDEAFLTDEFRRVTIREYCALGKTPEYLPKMRYALSDDFKLKAFDEAVVQYETYLAARALLEGREREAAENKFNEGLATEGTVHEG